MDPSCIFCKLEGESTMHILWNCPSSNNVWGACAKKLQKCTKGGDSFLVLLEELIDKCKVEELELFGVLAWSLWFRRNKVVHGEKLRHQIHLSRRLRG